MTDDIHVSYTPSGGQHIVAVPKHNSSLQPRLLGEANSIALDRVFETFSLNLIFVVLFLISPFGTPIVWSLDPQATSFYVFTVSSMLCVLNMVASRHPRILVWVMKRFDFVFAAINIVAWGGLQSLEFDWDSRIVPIWACIVPVFLLFLTTDATTSPFEFNLKKIVLVTAIVWASVILILSFGSLFQPYIHYALECSVKEGCSTYIHNHISAVIHNTTNGTLRIDEDLRTVTPYARHDPWDMTTTVSIKHIMDARLFTVLLWFLKLGIRAILHPKRCTLLTLPASTEIVVDEENHTEINKPLSLDPKSKEDIRHLGPDDDIYVYLPCEGSTKTFAEGPLHHIGYYLMWCNEQRTANFEAWCENHRLFGQIAMVVAWPLAFLGAMEILPHRCVWLCLLSLPDGVRCLSKLNVHALRHVVFKAFDVWFQIGCLAWEMVFFTISVGGDPALTCLVFVFAFMAVTNGVLDDADLTPRYVKGRGSPLIYIIFFILVLAFAVLLTTGAFPRGKSLACAFNHSISIYH